MTKKELITLLEHYPDDQEVLIAAEDREYGIDYFSKIAIESKKLRYSTWVTGGIKESASYYDCDETIWSMREGRMITLPFVEKEVIVLEAK